MAGRAFLSSVFQVILERLASRVFRDYLDEGLVNKLEITLDSINEVLNDAETKQYQNQNVENWLDDLKHEVYEVEKLLDVIAIDAQLKDKIQRFLSGSVNRHESMIKVLPKRLEVLADQKDRLGLQELTSGDYEIGVDRKLLREFRTVSLVDESIIYGREHEKQEIIEFLLSDSHSVYRIPVTSIVGLTGMGKTAVAQLVYNDHRIQEQFELKAWIFVPESFDLVGLTKSILKSFNSSTKSQRLGNTPTSTTTVAIGKQIFAYSRWCPEYQ